VCENKKDGGEGEGCKDTSDKKKKKLWCAPCSLFLCFTINPHCSILSQISDKETKKTTLFSLAVYCRLVSQKDFATEERPEEDRSFAKRR